MSALLVAASRLLTVRCLLAAIGTTVLISLLLALEPFKSTAECPPCPRWHPPDDILTKRTINNDSSVTLKHKLALIVPFRNRFEELLEFVPHMTAYLRQKHVPHQIFVMNQADSHRFNRASLINAGVLEASSTCDYMAMHDVDLLPTNTKLNYSYPGRNVAYHAAAPHLHPMYHYPKFVGGILLLTVDDFRKCNGLSNMYWGWGREDDEFYRRMGDVGMSLSRPGNIGTNSTNTFKHVHDRRRNPRDNLRYGKQKEIGRRRDRRTGLRDVKYDVLARYDVSVGDATARVINVRLHCNVTLTPWCDVPD